MLFFILLQDHILLLDEIADEWTLLARAENKVIKFGCISMFQCPVIVMDSSQYTQSMAVDK